MPSTPSEPFVRPRPKSKEKRILFLSASVGTGHMSAAEAVKKALGERYPEVNVRVVDAYDYAGALYRKIAAQGYIQVVKYFPQIYSFFYELGEKDFALLFFKSKFTQTMTKNFKKLLKEFRPDALVCTHAFPSGVASLLKNEFHVPVINIVTDFTVHPFWVHPNTDLYLVGNAQLADNLEKRGVDAKRIKVTGIPIDPRFNRHKEKSKAKAKLGLNPRLKTILIMGGGSGLGPIGWILRALSKIKQPLQVMVITGVNRGLKKRMDRYVKKLNGVHRKKTAIQGVTVYGFIDNVYEMMNAADLLITKPGGLTSSEALAAELPMVIVRPLPGQEIRNSEHLIKEKTAILVKKQKNIAATVDSLLSNPQQMTKLREHAKALKKPNAAYEAADHIMHLLA